MTNKQVGETLMHSVLLCVHSHIAPRFNCIDSHRHLFSLPLLLACRPNQSGNIWRGSHIPPLWAFRNLDGIDFPNIRFDVCREIVFAVSWIIQVPIPVKPIVGVQKAFRCTILITFDWMTVDSSDLADIYYLSSSCWEVLCRESWLQRRYFWQFQCSHTIMLKEWPGCLTISSVSEMYPTAVICLVWAWDSLCVARRFWQCCDISKKLWTLAVQCNVLSSASFFLSELFSVFFGSNTGSAPAKLPLLAWATSAKCKMVWKS